VLITRRGIRAAVAGAALIGSTLVAPPAVAAASLAPVVTGLSVTSGPTAGGAVMTIYGRRFGKVEYVRFGSARARHVHKLSSHRIRVVVPPNEARTVDVVVASRVHLIPNESSLNRHDRFTYYPRPSVSGLSPASGALRGGGAVRITGSDFRGVTRVTFGGVRATHVHALSTHTITVTAPAHAAGPADVRVETRYGSSKARRQDVFVYVRPPAVTGVQQATGPDVGGQTVKITGSDLHAGATVRFGVTAATDVHVWSLSLITATTPAHATGTVGVTVTTPYGTATKAGAYRFDPASRVYAWGSDARGDLGDGRLADRATPAEVLGLDQASVVLADPYAGGIELMLNGTVRQWGTGTLKYPSTAQSVPGLTDVTQVATSALTHYALRTDGTVWAWGDDSAGQLGDGQVRTTGCRCRATPAAVPGLDHVVSVTGGYLNAFAVKDDGTVWGWGKNQDGGLGIGSTDPTVPTPTQLTGLSHVSSLAATNGLGFAVDTDGAVWSWGCCGAMLGTGHTPGNSTSPVKITALSGIDRVTLGGAGAYAFATDGTVYAWGQDGLDGMTHASPIAVPALAAFTTISGASGVSFGVKADGTVFAWGDDSDGHLGLGTSSDAPVTTPTQVPGLTGITAVSTAGPWSFAYRPPS